MPDRLSIVHVDTATDWRGGQAQVEALVRGLARWGHAVALVTPAGSELARRLAGSGVEIVPDAPRGELDWQAGRRLRALVRERGADHLHVHSARAHAMAWWAIERTKTPRDSSNAPAGGLPLTGWPLVVSRRVDFALGGGWLSRRKYLHPACRYLAISMAVRDVLVRGGVAPERIHVVPSGIDPAKFTYRTNRDETRRALGIASTDLFVCNVAALVDHKDHATLVHAAKIALEAEPRLRFFVLGEGELRRPIEALIADFGIGERFRLLGFQEQVEPFVAAADLFVLSSHLEGLCTSLLDAMLLGVPIVATSAGGIPDVVVDGETGLLVEPRRSDALAAAIVRLAREPELRRRFAEAGARRVRERFLIEQTIALTERAYREILAGFHDQSCP